MWCAAVGSVSFLPPERLLNDILTKPAIMSLSVVGGLGAVLNVFFEMYGAEGRSTNQVVWLSTFPSLFVGIGEIPSFVIFSSPA